MKRTIALSVVLIFVLSISTVSVFAESAEYNQYSYTTYMDDGSYIVTTISESVNRSTKSGTKTNSYYSADDVLQWKVQVHGTFTYNGTTSSCTSASHTITIYKDSWSASSQTSYTSGNKAIAAVTMKKRSLGIVISTRSVNLQLACDANGNLS